MELKLNCLFISAVSNKLITRNAAFTAQMYFNKIIVIWPLYIYMLNSSVSIDGNVSNKFYEIVPKGREFHLNIKSKYLQRYSHLMHIAED